MTPRTFLLWSVVVVVGIDAGVGVPPGTQAVDTTVLKVVERQATGTTDAHQPAEDKPQVTSVKPAVTPVPAVEKNESKEVTSQAGSSRGQPGGSSTRVEANDHPGDDEGLSENKGLKGLSSDAVLRGFYVFIGVGTIVLLYIAIKFVRLRRRPSTQKYRVLSTTNDQEMLPLAADDGEDEEIYNAADHQHSIK